MGVDTKFLTRKEQAEYLHHRWGLIYSPQSLAKLASTGGGPKYCIFGRQAVSTRDWIDEWVAEKLSEPRRSTSECA